MTANKNEQDFVLRYFQSGKLNTQEALRKVKMATEMDVPGHCVSRKLYLRWMAIAASLLVLLAVGAYTLLMPRTVVLKTRAQVVAYDLPDGTKVTLSPYSSLSYSGDDCRKVEMKGCIYYQVKHDELHPFEVIGERGWVRVLGTQFLVDERTDAPEVMVTSGKVMFAARDSKTGVFLTKGKRARLLQGADKPESLAGYDVNDVAWATHQLHFEDTPLPEVLKELSKCYHGVRFRASDNHKRLSGDFCTDSIPQVVEIIEQTLDVKIDY